MYGCCPEAGDGWPDAWSLQTTEFISQHITLRSACRACTGWQEGFLQGAQRRERQSSGGAFAGHGELSLCCETITAALVSWGKPSGEGGEPGEAQTQCCMVPRAACRAASGLAAIAIVAPGPRRAAGCRQARLQVLRCWGAASPRHRAAHALHRNDPWLVSSGGMHWAQAERMGSPCSSPGSARQPVEARAPAPPGAVACCSLPLRITRSAQSPGRAQQQPPLANSSKMVAMAALRVQALFGKGAKAAPKKAAKAGERAAHGRAAVRRPAAPRHPAGPITATASFVGMVAVPCRRAGGRQAPPRRHRYPALTPLRPLPTLSRPQPPPPPRRVA